VPRSYPWFKTEGENGPASEEPRRPDTHGCIMVWMIEDDTSIILHRIQGCWRRWPPTNGRLASDCVLAGYVC